ncbi:uncharacterized protein METZ01_LOCUS420781 [marine metagenome]|uniref:Uncharacterized protein n=1 Tax=marine metagenome TaxID=408172 RepID=A0A382X9S7_9ZZZZ
MADRGQDGLQGRPGQRQQGAEELWMIKVNATHV